LITVYNIKEQDLPGNLKNTVYFICIFVWLYLFVLLLLICLFVLI